MSLRTPLGAGIPSFSSRLLPACPQRPSSSSGVADPRRLAGAMAPPSGECRNDPRSHGGDPSLEEVLLEAGVAIQHQCEPDSAFHPWPLNSAVELLWKYSFGPSRRNFECLRTTPDVPTWPPVRKAGIRGLTALLPTSFLLVAEQEAVQGCREVTYVIIHTACPVSRGGFSRARCPQERCKQNRCVSARLETCRSNSAPPT